MKSTVTQVNTSPEGPNSRFKQKEQKKFHEDRLVETIQSEEQKTKGLKIINKAQKTCRHSP